MPEAFIHAGCKRLSFENYKPINSSWKREDMLCGTRRSVVQVTHRKHFASTCCLHLLPWSWSMYGSVKGSCEHSDSVTQEELNIWPAQLPVGWQEGLLHETVTNFHILIKWHKTTTSDTGQTTSIPTL